MSLRASCLHCHTNVRRCFSERRKSSFERQLTGILAIKSEDVDVLLDSEIAAAAAKQHISRHFEISTYWIKLYLLLLNFSLALLFGLSIFNSVPNVRRKMTSLQEFTKKFQIAGINNVGDLGSGSRSYLEFENSRLIMSIEIVSTTYGYVNIQYSQDRSRLFDFLAGIPIIGIPKRVKEDSMNSPPRSLVFESQVKLKSDRTTTLNALVNSSFADNAIESRANEQKKAQERPLFGLAAPFEIKATLHGPKNSKWTVPTILNPEIRYPFLIRQGKIGIWHLRATVPIDSPDVIPVEIRQLCKEKEASFISMDLIRFWWWTLSIVSYAHDFKISIAPVSCMWGI